MNRPTPETERNVEDIGMGCLMVNADFARKLEQERNEAMDVLSNLSHYLSCGLGDETTTAKEYGARIRDGINALLDPILEEKNKLAKELKEAWLAMDEIEGTDRINEWRNKNANIFNTEK